MPVAGGGLVSHTMPCVICAYTKQEGGNVAQPTCPECSVSGIEHVVSKDSVEHSRRREAWFYVVYCSECGHVYGVFSKHVFTQSKPVQFVMPGK